MNSDQPTSVHANRLDLHHWDQVGHAIHHIRFRQDRSRRSHDFLDRVSGARTVKGRNGNDGHRLRVIQLQTLRGFSATSAIM